MPNFLIVGAARCGTTSLYEALRQHPEVFMPPSAKEPSYFVPQAGVVSQWNDYLALFEGSETYARRGEASVSYLMEPTAARRIADALGHDIRIVIMLRDPIAMAYSNWGHQVRRGCEKMAFVDALKDEDRRLSDPHFAEECRCWVSDVTYVARARFGEQVARYLEVFGLERVACFLFEEFFRDGLPQFSDLCRFLGIDDGYQPVNEVHNQAGVVRSPHVRRMLTERMAWKEPLKRLIPVGARRAITRGLARFNNVERAPDPIPGEAVTLLRAQFGEDIRLLSRLIQRPDLPELWSLACQPAA